MLSRRNWMIAFVALLLVASLAACSSAVAVPNRDIEVNVDSALAAQNKIADLMTAGKVDWTENEFSSLLTVLLEQNSGENNPIASIKVWFQPDNKFYAQISLVDGVLPNTIAAKTLELVGTVDVEDGKVVLNLDGASAGGFGVAPAMLSPINEQINAALAGLNLGVPVNVSTDTGEVSVSVGQ